MARNKNEQENVSGRKHYHHTVGGKCDWSKQDGAFILECIESIVSAGGAVRFGKTRDGGCFSVGVYGDGTSPYTDYLRPDEDVREYFTDLVTAFNVRSVGGKA